MKRVFHLALVVIGVLYSCQREQVDDLDTPPVEDDTFIEMELTSSKSEVSLVMVGENSTKAELNATKNKLWPKWYPDDVLVVVGEKTGILGKMSLVEYATQDSSVAHFRGTIPASLFPKGEDNNQYVRLYYIHKKVITQDTKPIVPISIQKQNGELPDGNSPSNTYILHIRTDKEVDFDELRDAEKYGKPAVLNFGEKIVMESLLAYVYIDFESAYTDSFTLPADPRTFTIGGCYNSVSLDLLTGEFVEYNAGPITLNTTYGKSRHFYLALIPNKSTKSTTVIQIREERTAPDGKVYNGLLAKSTPANVKSGRFYYRDYSGGVVEPLVLSDSKTHLYEESKVTNTVGEKLKWGPSGIARQGVLVGCKNSTYGTLTYEWAPVNLGTDFSIQDKNVSDYGLLFQWGRKWGQGGSDSHYSSTDPDHKCITDTYSGDPADEPDSFTNINTFYGVNALVWYSDPASYSGNLWNEGTEQAPIKTGRDPCPDGWRVPTQYEMNTLKLQTQASYGSDSYDCVHYNDGQGNTINSVIPVKNVDFRMPLAGTRNREGKLDERYFKGYYATSKHVVGDPAKLVDSPSYPTRYHIFGLLTDEYYEITEVYKVQACSIRCIHDYSFDYSQLSN